MYAHMFTPSDDESQVDQRIHTILCSCAIVVTIAPRPFWCCLLCSRCSRQGYGNRCTYSKRRSHQFPPTPGCQHDQTTPTVMLAADALLHSTSGALACGMLPLKRFKPISCCPDCIVICLRNHESTSCSYLENSNLLSLLPNLLVKFASFCVLRGKNNGDISSTHRRVIHNNSSEFDRALRVICCRCRLSASPATGLVGMRENAFLNDFFGCVGFFPLTTQR